MALCAFSASSCEECLLSAVYTFSSTVLPENSNSVQLSCVHGLVRWHRHICSDKIDLKNCYDVYFCLFSFQY